MHNEELIAQIIELGQTIRKSFEKVMHEVSAIYDGKVKYMRYEDAYPAKPPQDHDYYRILNPDDLDLFVELVDKENIRDFDDGGSGISGHHYEGRKKARACYIVSDLLKAENWQFTPDELWAYHFGIRRGRAMKLAKSSWLDEHKMKV